MLYVEIIFIIENINRDIIVLDNGKKVIVVIDELGRYFFNYKGYYFWIIFYLGGVCIDVFGYIFVCNVFSDLSVYLFNKKG